MNKRSTNDMHALDIRKIARVGLFRTGGSFTFQWTRGSTVMASIGGIVDSANSVTLHYCMRRPDGEWQDMRYPVTVEWTACHYGSTRPWWNCPCCAKRVAVLWGGSTYACRQCQKINYESTRTTDSNKPFDRADKLRKRLGWVPGIARGIGERPKGMHLTTYYRLAHKYTVHAQATFESMEKLFSQLNR